jgi:pimeloyl-ACP methyl ester carboxylesterase
VTFDDCRQLVLERLEKAYPSKDSDWTTEVDVIGFSMGGVTARYAAMQPQPDNDCPRLGIARLFTIGTPHRGASLAADKKVLDPLSRDMQPACAFIEKLNEQRGRETYPIIAYVRLNDTTVGEANAAPPGVTPHWLSAEPFTRSHGGGYHDPRILADIARHLRGETPYTASPAAPLPQ